jgi:phosphohistidine swiveling domain-containing protein
MYGSKPFSVLARCAFIAEEFLRSFIRLGCLTDTRALEFKGSVKTVLTEFLNSSKRMTTDQFLVRYGHLRPGTYDLLSPCYAKRGKDFIEKLTSASRKNKHEDKTAFVLTASESEAIRKVLKETRFDVSVEELFHFIREAIASREYAKLKFTMNVSATLELVSVLGESLSFSDKDMSHLSIHNVLKFNKMIGSKTVKDEVLRLSTQSKDDYEVTKSIRLPSTICSVADVRVCPLLKAQPNFITHKSISGELFILKGSDTVEGQKLNNKIVLIEGADPGFDWIFTHQIKALITKFGGTNSHMAIRCAELEIPAVIGCGTQLYENLSKTHEVFVCCATRELRMIR